VRAAYFKGSGGPEVIEIVELPDPVPGPEQVLVRVEASGINRAEILQRRGRYPAPAGAAANVPGLEFAGVVQALGEGVTHVQEGQRVFGIVGGGGQAELLVTHERLLAPVPDNLDSLQAAAVPEAFITAHDALFTQAGLAPGERVLVHAVGSGVGSAAVQLARAAGCLVLGTSRTADKLEQARELGLDFGIDSSRQEVSQAVAEFTEGKGVQVCIDFIGGPALEDNLKVLGSKGRLVVVGSLGGAQGQLSISLLMSKRLKITGTVLRSRTLEEKAVATQLFAEQVVPQLARGLVRPIVDRVYPLEQLADAHRQMESNQNFGKIVIALG
jgi:putative PIG3 family NAD(P)H quinone oxidoreductase